MWFSPKKSMRLCKICLCDVHEPEPPSKSTGSATKKPEERGRSSLRKRRTSNYRSSKSTEIVHQLKGQLHRLSDHGYSSPVGRSDSERVMFYGALHLHRRHLSMHAVTELGKEDASRKVVEIICQRRWLKNEEYKFMQIDKVFKVNNTEKTLSEFEEHRETVKEKASKLPMKLPRCLADGNEHLRFHCTTMACSLGLNQPRGLCTQDSCGVCSILRGGFSEKWFNGKDGIFTSGSSRRALESVSLSGKERSLNKALMVCRVLAGRIVNGDIERGKEAIDSGFDSLGGKLSRSSKFDDELLVMNPRALLPCFIVTYKPLKSQTYSNANPRLDRQDKIVQKVNLLINKLNSSETWPSLKNWPSPKPDIPHT